MVDDPVAYVEAMIFMKWIWPKNVVHVVCNVVHRAVERILWPGFRYLHNTEWMRSDIEMIHMKSTILSTVYLCENTFLWGGIFCKKSQYYLICFGFSIYFYRVSHLKMYFFNPSFTTNSSVFRVKFACHLCLNLQTSLVP